jgi:methenyltetrahydromethanopterin cyclohydrolase
MAGNLNERAFRLADQMAAEADDLRVCVHETAGARIIDCGVEAQGGLQAGLRLARICLADLAEVTLAPGRIGTTASPTVQVATDHPVRACLAAQYAGWRIQVGDFFAMGSGPMRAAFGREDLFDHIQGRERAQVAVGVLESRVLPGPEVVRYLCEGLGLPAAKLTLLVAPAASLAGTVQIVARALETALHKLHELKFDVGQVFSGVGAAPLPPGSADEIQAIGRSNDAILYGGRALLWLQGSDEQVAQVGPRVPSSASHDHGVPFAVMFQRYDRDFYRIDPMLFSPAQIVFQNVNTGRAHVFGWTEPDVLRRSFFE